MSRVRVVAFYFIRPLRVEFPHFGFLTNIPLHVFLEHWMSVASFTAIQTQLSHTCITGVVVLSSQPVPVCYDTGISISASIVIMIIIVVQKRCDDFIFSSPSTVFSLCLCVCRCPTSHASLQLPAFVCQVPWVSLCVAHLCLSADLPPAPPWPRPTGGSDWGRFFFFSLPKAFFVVVNWINGKKCNILCSRFHVIGHLFPPAYLLDHFWNPQLKKKPSISFFCQYYSNAHQENDKNQSHNVPLPGRLFHVGCCGTSVGLWQTWKMKNPACLHLTLEIRKDSTWPSSAKIH